MRIGAFVDQHGPLDEVIGRFAGAAALGIPTFWCTQTFDYDTLALLALVGREVEGVELGTAALQAFAIHPIALARQVLTTAAGCDGRLLLGIGPSHRPAMEGMFRDVARRSQRAGCRSTSRSWGRCCTARRSTTRESPTARRLRRSTDTGATTSVRAYGSGRARSVDRRARCRAAPDAGPRRPRAPHVAAGRGALRRRYRVDDGPRADAATASCRRCAPPRVGHAADHGGQPSVRDRPARRGPPRAGAVGRGLGRTAVVRHRPGASGAANMGDVAIVGDERAVTRRTGADGGGGRHRLPRPAHRVARRAATHPRAGGVGVDRRALRSGPWRGRSVACARTPARSSSTSTRDVRCASPAIATTRSTAATPV